MKYIVLPLLCAWWMVGQAGGQSGDPLQQARALMAEGVWFEAAETLARYLARSPTDHEARFELAQLYFRLSRYREAVEAALQVRAQRPDHEGARRLLVRIRMRMGAELNWQRVEEVVEFARLCARMESFDRARACYLRALEMNDAPSIRRELAAMLSWAGRYEEAVSHYLRYLAQVPDDAAARSELGRAYNAIDRLSDAEAELRRAISADPNLLAARVELARTLTWLGQDAEADRLLVEVIARDAKGIEPRLLRARLLLRKDRLEEAYALLSEVARLDPEQREAQQMIQQLEESRRLEIARLQRRLETHPDHEEDRRRLLELLLEIQRPEEVHRLMERWGVGRPLPPTIQEQLIALREAQRRKVLTIVRRYCDLRNPATGLSWEKLISWLRRHSNDARARAMLERRPPSAGKAI